MSDISSPSVEDGGRGVGFSCHKSTRIFEKLKNEFSALSLAGVLGSLTFLGFEFSDSFLMIGRKVAFAPGIKKQTSKKGERGL